MKKTSKRDQRWLRETSKIIIESKNIKYYRQINRENHLKFNKNIEALKDLNESYCAVIGDITVAKRNRRVISFLMAAWLRDQSKIVPSPSSFRRFFQLKSNT